MHSFIAKLDCKTMATLSFFLMVVPLFSEDRPKLFVKYVVVEVSVCFVISRDSIAGLAFGIYSLY